MFNDEIAREDALEEQVKMEKLLMSFKKYNPSNDYKIEKKRQCRRSV